MVRGVKTLCTTFGKAVSKAERMLSGKYFAVLGESGSIMN